MLDWDKLRVFHVVARAGSLTHAGEELGLSQSAVSRQIGALEETLGLALFHRHARGLGLTEQGEILFRTTADIANQVTRTQMHLTDSRERPRGLFRITTTVGFGTVWLSPRLREFKALYPDIELSLLLDDSDLDLGNRQADVAIRLHAPSESNLIARKLFKVHYHLYASPDYLKRRGTPSALDDLDHHDIVTYGDPVPKAISDVNWIACAGRTARSPRSSVLKVNSILGIMKAVEAGMGLAALPDYLCEGNAHLVRIMSTIEAPCFETHFVYAEEMRHSKRVAVFRDFMLRKASEWAY